MQEVTMYKASDGRIYERKDLCEAYEREIKLREDLNDIIPNDIREYDNIKKTVVECIIKESESIRQILNRHCYETTIS